MSRDWLLGCLFVPQVWSFLCLYRGPTRSGSVPLRQTGGRKERSGPTSGYEGSQRWRRSADVDGVRPYTHIHTRTHARTHTQTPTDPDRDHTCCRSGLLHGIGFARVHTQKLVPGFPCSVPALPTCMVLRCCWFGVRVRWV